MRPLLLACLLACAVSAAPIERTRAARPGAGPPSLVLVVLDDVAAADLALWGGTVACPNLSALAAGGVRFDLAYSNPTCSPTRRALLSGAWWVTGSGVQCPGDLPGPETPPAGSLLPALLPAAFTSGLAGKWHLGAHPMGGAAERAPIAHGFDFWSAGSPANVNECGGSSYTSWLRVDAQTGWHVSGPSSQHEAAAVRQAFVSGWGAVPAPRLAVVAWNLAHAPFHAPPATMLPPGYVVAPGPRGRFEAMVAAGDFLLGGLLAAIDLSSTVVVVVGDNGTPPNVAPVAGKAKGSTFERGVRVPLVIAGGPVVGGRVVGELVHVVDIAATLLELAGASATAPDGVSLLPILRDDPGWQAPREWALLGSRWGTPDGDVASVRWDRTKLRMLDPDGDGVADSLEFYDLAQDPDELVNLVSDPAWGPAVVDHLVWASQAIP